MAKIHVPPRGDESASIMIVGEAPGEDEERERKPFVGRSGQLQARYLSRVGIDESEVFLTNLYPWRPPRNKLKSILDTPDFQRGLSELVEQINHVQPNVILSSGAWPMYYLTGKMGEVNKKPTPGTGIMKYRGSTFPNILVPDGPKVYLGFHPAFIIRASGFKWNPIYLIDIQRTVEESTYPELPWPQYESYIDPDEFTLHDLIERFDDAELITIDIETFGGELACIGFTTREDWGLCLTYQKPGAFWVAEDILLNDRPKCFQFGNYDINWLRHHKGWRTRAYIPSEGMGWDTYVAAASLMPEFPRRLDFLSSLYTRFPYYKTERKKWKEEGDLTILWEYNIKDVIATHQIALQQREEIEELYGVPTQFGSGGRGGVR